MKDTYLGDDQVDTSEVERVQVINAKWLLLSDNSHFFNYLPTPQHQ
jgi:hypothetical protein